MELYKEKLNDGLNIYCVIGYKTNVSWWSSPPLSIDHVCIRYLSNRYPIISTQKRLDTFKKLYKELMKNTNEEANT